MSPSEGQLPSKNFLQVPRLSHIHNLQKNCTKLCHSGSGYSKKRNIIPVLADFFSWFSISVSRKPSKLNIKFTFSNFLLPPSFLLQESTVKKTPDLTGRKTCTLRAWTYTANQRCCFTLYFVFCRLYPFSPSHHGIVRVLPVISLYS
jgi:hypothetical protein